MSERMSRREMRRAGLLKPRPAADDPPTDESASAGTPDTASDTAPAAHATIEPPRDPASGPSYEGEEGSEAPVQTASYGRDDADDGEAELGETVETEPPAPVGAETPEEGQAEGSPQSQAESEENPPGRTSVFDRFSSSSEPAAEKSPADSGGATDPTSSAQTPDESFARAVHDELSSDEDDEDYAGALRAKLKSKPPAEDRADEPAPDADVSEEPSRWKTIALFLLLIVVGFGVGILLGSLIFTGGDSSSAPALADYFYPGAL